MGDAFKVLDLFSGIGGFSLGLERTGGFETVAFCEIDPFCQKVLRKHWPDVPIHGDIRELTGDDVGAVDVITGGFPCQPFSTSGKQRGAADDRHVWPEMFRLVREILPRYIIGENVAGIINMALDNVLSDLETVGYAAGAVTIPACAVGRDQRRERVWILAHALPWKRSLGRDTPGGRGQPEQVPWHGMGEEKAPPRVVGGFDGIPEGLDRIKALGNAVVPQIPEIIGRAILAAEDR